MYFLGKLHNLECNGTFILIKATAVAYVYAIKRKYRTGIQKQVMNAESTFWLLWCFPGCHVLFWWMWNFTSGGVARQQSASVINITWRASKSMLPSCKSNCATCRWCRVADLEAVGVCIFSAVVTEIKCAPFSGVHRSISNLTETVTFIPDGLLVTTCNQLQSAAWRLLSDTKVLTRWRKDS